MPELPPDPDRLRAILAYLEQQVADNETVGIYLRIQRDAVLEALIAAEVGKPAGPRPPTAGPVLEATPTAEPTPTSARLQRPTGFVIDRHRTPDGPEPASVHLGDCNLTSSIARPVSAERARAAIADGLEACAICRPDTELGILEG
jgi:hypothetical protein